MASKSSSMKTEEDNNASLSFICDLCGKGYPNHTSLQKHIKEVHADIRIEHQHCPKCEKHFPNMRRFWNHVILAHESGGGGDDDEEDEGTKDVEIGGMKVPGGKTATDPKVEALWRMSEDDEPMCIQCNKSFASRDGVRKHIRHQHLGRKRAQHPCECPKCGKGFTERNRLTKHLKNVHKLLTSDFPCNLCTIVLLSADGLLRHKKNFHGLDEEPPPSDTPATNCPYCSEVFYHEGCEAHVRALHREHYEEFMKSVKKKSEGNHKCDTCGATFAENRMLRRHISRIHATDGCYQCLKCGKSFAEHVELQNHLAVHQNAILEPHVKAMLKTVFGVVCQSSFTCGICQIVVSSAAEAKIHMYIMHPDQFDEMVRKQAAGLICSVCNERKATKEDMIEHMDLNHPEDTLPTCGVCGHRELKERDMHIHHRRYHPEAIARHVCEICQATFNQKRELIHHVKRHSDNAVQCPYCPERHLKVKSHVTRKHPEHALEYKKLVDQAIRKEREARKRFNQFLEGKSQQKKKGRIGDRKDNSGSNDEDDEESDDDDGLDNNEGDEEVDMKPIPSECVVQHTKPVTLEKYTIEKRVEQPHVIEIQRIAQPDPPPEPEEILHENDDNHPAVEGDIKPLNLTLSTSQQNEEETHEEDENANLEVEEETQPQVGGSQTQNNLLCNKVLVITVKRLTESEISKWIGSSVMGESTPTETIDNNDVTSKPSKKRRRRRRY